jgi:hypothetical protein
MSYCSTSFNRQDFLPGITSIADGRRTCSVRSNISQSYVDSGISQHQVSYSLLGNHDIHGSGSGTGIWNKMPINGEYPEMKSGQTLVYWTEGNAIICCYGKSKDDSYSNEFWKLSLENCEWEKIEMKENEKITPRAACGCVVVNSTMYIFGGITCTSNFVQDYHIVDLETKEVTFPETTGELPPPCALPMTAFHDKYFIVWAGTSGSNLNSLHILDTETNVWRKIQSDFVGRKGACSCVLGSTLYIYGATCPMSMLVLDLVSFEFKAITTVGVEPPHNCDCLSMTPSSATNFMGFECSTILAFESNSSASETRIYVFDTKKNSWMGGTIAISADSQVTLSNGSGSQENFDLSERHCGFPRIVFYLPFQRKLLSLSWETCSKDEKNEQSLSELSIGKMVSSLNQRIDFLSALKVE